jgi:hypothetical protein
MRLSTRLAGAALGTLLVASACGDAKGETSQPEPLTAPLDDPRCAPAPEDASATFLTIDEQYVDVVRRAPGFAGIYYDPHPVLVIALTDPTQAETARCEVARTFRLDTANAQIRVVKYDFAQLFRWKNVVGAKGMQLGMVSLDADEFRNVVAVGVLEGTSLEEVRAAIEAAGVPSDALEVSIEEPFVEL